MDIQFDQDDRHAVLTITGELDIATVPALDDTIDRTMPWDAIDELTVDLCGVDFMDSSGLAALIRLKKQNPDTEIAIRVSRRGTVQRLLEITSMPELFAIEIIPRSV